MRKFELFLKMKSATTAKGYERRPDLVGGSEELRATDSVLKVLESMFFSMPIPEEIMEKYNFLKENKFKRAGLDFVPITRAQYPSIGTTATKGPVAQEAAARSQELEDCFISLYDDQLSLFESIFNYITDRSTSLIDLIRNPMKSPYCTHNSANDSG